MDVNDNRPTELTEEMKKAQIKLDDFGVYLEFRFDENEKKDIIFVNSFGNNFNFEYRLGENNAITQINGIGQTMMGFFQGIQEKDDLLLHVLWNTRFWEINGNELIFMDDKKSNLVVFDTNDQNPSLKESQWFVRWIKEE